MIINDRRTGEKLLEIPGDTLVGGDLRELDLRYADFSDLELSRCNFDGLDLEGIQFSNAILVDASFVNCNLAEAIFTRADLSGAKLIAAKLSMTAFSHAILKEANLSEIVIDGMVNFRWIRAQRSKFRNIIDLSGANFFEADLTNADLEGSDFLQVNESDRTGTILKGTIFEHLML